MHIETYLETLQIMWCGDLSMVFKGSANWRLFPSLKRIHLHELPKLQGICDVGCNTDAANLATIKIRGCWNLKSLPNVAGKNVVECDCKKEWWDSLEWDPYVEPSLQYTPTHPRPLQEDHAQGLRPQLIHPPLCLPCSCLDAKFKIPKLSHRMKILHAWRIKPRRNKKLIA